MDDLSSARHPTGPSYSQSYAGKARRVRERVRSRNVTNLIYRVTVGVIGLAVLVTGLIMVPFPGPGWLVVIIGLAILASEFAWAQGLLDFVKDKVTAWTHWIAGQGWPVRIAVGLGTALCVAGALYGVAVVFGVPAWIPDAWIPDLPGL